MTFLRRNKIENKVQKLTICEWSWYWVNEGTLHYIYFTVNHKQSSLSHNYFITPSKKKKKIIKGNTLWLFKDKQKKN